MPKPPLATPTVRKNCKNCWSPLAENDLYCAACGQKYRQRLPSFGELIKTAFEAVFNLDGRLFRSLKNLLIPGRLTNYYLAGREKAYIHPLRLFLVSGALFVAALSFFAQQQLGETIDRWIQNRNKTAYEKTFNAQLHQRIDSLEQLYPSPEASLMAKDLLRSLDTLEADTMWITYLHHNQGLSFEQRELDISITDYQLAPIDSIAAMYGVEGLFNQYLVGKIVQIIRGGTQALKQLTGQLIWGILLAVPLLALLLKLFYIRHNKPYILHLIFSLHLHSFYFLALLLLVVLTFSGASLPWLYNIILLSLPTYFVVAIARVYPQRYWKILLKSFLLSGVYLLILILAIVFTSVVAILAA